MARRPNLKKSLSELLVYQSIDFAMRTKIINKAVRQDMYSYLAFNEDDSIKPHIDKLVREFCAFIKAEKDKVCEALSVRERLTKNQVFLVLCALNYNSNVYKLESKERNKLYTLVYYPSVKNSAKLIQIINDYATFINTTNQ